MCDPADLPRFIYAATTHADDIASCGKLVMEAAANGDAVAQTIMNRAGHDLAECVVAVARRLSLTSESFPVAFVGGAFHAGDQLLEPMRAAILSVVPRAELIAPLHTPAEGAAMMAIRAAAMPRANRA